MIAKQFLNFNAFEPCDSLKKDSYNKLVAHFFHGGPKGGPEGEQQGGQKGEPPFVYT